ncbi:MAG: hypothetical protein SVK08_00080 [Halobacteriota archaeon]|nr:hypothetical protein [Halobacteriota archaeon]
MSDDMMPEPIATGEYSESELIDWIVESEMVLLHDHYAEMRPFLLDFDVRVMIDAMVLSAFTEEEIAERVIGGYPQIYIDVYLDAFFNIKLMTNDEILDYLSMIRETTEARIKKEAISKGSKEYITWLVGAKSKRMAMEDILDDIARGYHIKQKELLMVNDIDGATKLANVAIKAAKEATRHKSEGGIKDLLNALENVEFEIDDEPKIYTIDELQTSPDE